MLHPTIDNNEVLVPGTLYLYEGEMPACVKLMQGESATVQFANQLSEFQWSVAILNQLNERVQITQGRTLSTMVKVTDVAPGAQVKLLVDAE